jgi:hypothetical protein
MANSPLVAFGDRVVHPGCRVCVVRDLATSIAAFLGGECLEVVVMGQGAHTLGPVLR